VLSPIDGRVEVQIVAVGDYVKVGDPLFRLVGTTQLARASAFPEKRRARAQQGQRVRLSSPLVPARLSKGR